MLSTLSIKNFILIDSLNVDFKSGLCVISGETGAGKSIILNALGLVLGERGNVKFLKDNTRPAVISAQFEIFKNEQVKTLMQNNGFEDSDILILKRVFESNGKSRCFVNETLASVNLLQKFGELLIEISTQHEQRGLFDLNQHRNLLDNYANLEYDLNELAQVYFNWKDAVNKLQNIISSKEKSEDEKNYLTHIVKELTNLNPVHDEELHLNEIRNTLREKGKIQDAINYTLGEANKNIVFKLNNIIKTISKVDILKPAEKFFEAALIELMEGVDSVEKINDQLSSSKHDLNSIEERLFSLRSIARKYNTTDLEEFLIQTKEQLTLIENFDEVYNNLDRISLKFKDEYIAISNTLSKNRKHHSQTLEKNIMLELNDLKMGYAQFKIDIASLPQENWNSHGHDKVRFLARTNPNSQFEAINRCASGGELSRFFLSLKIALIRIKSSPTIIFDEIDVGVGGAVADSIGKKLTYLAQNHQILVITHQPQIAVYSKNHYLVRKTINASDVSVQIKPLDDQQKVQEIARMLSGQNITDQSIEAAKALIAKSMQF